MNWARLRLAPWLDTRAKFVAPTPKNGILLDIGSSDGETLRHFAELRPDLRFFATDLVGQPETYPTNCQFFRGDLQKDPLPWPNEFFNAITCMHLVEHLCDLTLLFKEAARLLKPGGRIYFETPHPKSLIFSSPAGDAAGTFTLNFYDDLTHVRPVTVGVLAQYARRQNLKVLTSGTSRNWLFAAAHLIYAFRPPSRQRHTSFIHWHGWSAYLIAQRPP
jgi:SAM-dependent methyltransferase